MDIAACLSAEQLARTCCVTLSMDHLLFDNTSLVEIGSTILIEAQVVHRLCITAGRPVTVSRRWFEPLHHLLKS
jgi:hypothetical protein